MSNFQQIQAIIAILTAIAPLLKQLGPLATQAMALLRQIFDLIRQMKSEDERPLVGDVSVDPDAVETAVSTMTAYGVPEDEARKLLSA